MSEWVNEWVCVPYRRVQWNDIYIGGGQSREAQTDPHRHTHNYWQMDCSCNVHLKSAVHNKGHGSEEGWWWWWGRKLPTVNVCVVVYVLIITRIRFSVSADDHEISGGDNTDQLSATAKLRWNKLKRQWSTGKSCCSLFGCLQCTCHSVF